MDQVALVADEIDDGRKLVELLRNRGFQVTAASWMKSSEEDKWFLYIASPDVDRGLKGAYRIVHTVIRNIPTQFSIEPFDVRLLSARDPLVVEVDELRRRFPTRSFVRLGGQSFAGRSIDGAIVYL